MLCPVLSSVQRTDVLIPSWMWKQVCISQVTWSLLDGCAVEGTKGVACVWPHPLPQGGNVKMCPCCALQCGRRLLCSVPSQGVLECSGTLPIRTHTSCQCPACLHTITLRRSLSFLCPQAARTWLNHLAPSLLLQGEITHDEFCAACKRGASLQPCGTCSGAYHLSCLDPPLKTAPKGVWVCPKCQRKVWAEGLTPLPCTFETVFWVIPSMGGAGGV